MESNAYKAENGKRFAWSLILPSAVYGYRNQLINDSGKSLVEIYDFDTKQMISRYYLPTLLNNYKEGQGINLDGGVAAWSIDGQTWGFMISDIRRA